MTEKAESIGTQATRQKTPQVILYLWGLIPLGIFGAVITLGLIIWIYQSISTANKEAEELDRKILSSMSAITLMVEHVETDFRDVFNRDPDHFASENSIGFLDAEIETLQDAVRAAVKVDGQIERVDTGDLHRLREESLAWCREDERYRSMRTQAWADTKAAIGEIRSEMSSLLGRRRIQSILAAKMLRSSGLDQRDELVNEFLEESKIGSMLSMSMAELSDLEIMCGRLANEQDIDLVESIVQNEISPRLDRLQKQVGELDSDELNEGLNRVVTVVLGEHGRDAIEESSHSGAVSVHGLRGSTVDQLRNEQLGVALHDEVIAAMHKMKLRLNQQVDEAKSLRSVVADVAAKTLRAGGMTVVIVCLVIGVVYCLLAYKIALSVQRFVRDLHESHEALRQANIKANEANRELQESIDERERLQHQLMEAQKLESIGQLAAGIAHEINTPAQYVGDNTRFLQSEFKGLIQVLDEYTGLMETSSEPMSWEERNQKMHELIETVDFEFIRKEIPLAIDQSLEGVERITHIVKAMKDFSHPGSATKEHADLNAAIQSTAVVCTNRWKYVADVEFDLDPALMPVPCLLGELNQVILNLIVNAADAIDSFRDHADGKGKIIVSSKQLDGWVRVCVTDNGGGMPESVRARIFDPFYTTKEVGKGTGQGLAISRDVIVTKHGGTLSCETTEGEGTTFIIELPLEQHGEVEHVDSQVAA